MEILAFSRTTGYRHDSIPAGLAALRRLGHAVTATEDPAALTELSGFAAVVFLSTTEDELATDGQRAALERYVRGGGGFVGVHAAASTEYSWPFYGELVGAWFRRHPDIQPARVVVEDAGHPATEHLPPVWERVDEWYDFHTNPRAGVRVLLSVDESSYTGGEMGADHPLAWCHENLGGRSFYTALGHTTESYAEPAFLAHLAGGIRWVTSR